MLVVTDHNKLLKDAMNKIGLMTNMSDFIAEWVEKSFGMTTMMPDGPLIQANVTFLSDIEKLQSNSNPDLLKKKTKKKNKIIHKK